MQFGEYEISTHIFDRFRLDGGAMFGVVPKAIWQRKIPADELNRIQLVTRSLLVRHQKRVFLIDTGFGSNWSEKKQKMYELESSALNKDTAAEITDIVITHLHFDHAGGLLKSSKLDSSPSPAFPGSHVYLQKDNLENAKSPSPREKASYLKEHCDVLNEYNLHLLTAGEEIYPGIKVHRTNGHTKGQQWIEIESCGNLIFYPSDLIATSHHLHLPFHMGYDINAELLLKEKEKFLNRAVAEQAVVVFAHDHEIGAATIRKDPKGRFVVEDVVDIL